MDKGNAPTRAGGLLCLFVIKQSTKVRREKMNTKAIRKAAAALLASCLLVSTTLPGLASTLSADSAAQTSILDLTTEYLENPIGIDTDTPRFGWRMQSNLIGQMQQAYEVTLYKESEPDNAIWSTGKVESGLSVCVNYDGDPLDNATGYLWTVKVWDKDGKTYTSEPARFETGVTDEQGWLDTEFIQLPASGSAPIFRTEQEIGGKVDSPPACTSQPAASMRRISTGNRSARSRMTRRFTTT